MQDWLHVVCTGKQDFLQLRNTWLALPLQIHWHLLRLSMMAMLLTLSGLMLLVPNLMQLRNVATFLARWLRALQLWMLLQARWQVRTQIWLLLGCCSWNLSASRRRGADGGFARSLRPRCWQRPTEGYLRL